jgi:hypothetical protein
MPASPRICSKDEGGGDGVTGTMQKTAVRPKKNHQNLIGWLFLLPALISFSLFKYYPIVLGMVVSLFKVDIVHFGCPLLIYEEIQQIARAIKGKKVHKDVMLWVQTDTPSYYMAKHYGDAAIIEEAGGSDDRCAYLASYPTMVKPIHTSTHHLHKSSRQIHWSLNHLYGNRHRFRFEPMHYSDYSGRNRSIIALPLLRLTEQHQDFCSNPLLHVHRSADRSGSPHTVSSAYHSMRIWLWCAN